MIYLCKIYVLLVGRTVIKDGGLLVDESFSEGSLFSFALVQLLGI